MNKDKVFLYLSVLSVSFWSICLALVFYLAAVAMMSESGQGGHGDAEAVFLAIFAICTILMGVPALIALGTYVTGQYSRKWYDFIVVTLISILISFMITFSVALLGTHLWRWTFELGKTHFCSEAFREEHRSPHLGCYCEPSACAM